MKTTKLTYPLALALVCAVVATGCGGHKVMHTTQIPGVAALPPPEPPIGNTLNNNEAASPQPNPSDFYNGMKTDRAALAANTVHFAYDSAAIKKAEHANIQAVAQALSSDPSTKLLIEGNCDERGTEEYNRSLGERRAGSARKELVKLGISASRIMTKSFGKDNPVDQGQDEAARAKNRRDDFVILRAAPGGGGGSTVNGS